MAEALSPNLVVHLDESFRYISMTLHIRQSPLARSRSLGDQYESINAAVYLLSSAASQTYVSRQARLCSFDTGWSTYGPQSAEEMTESGFYFLGDADHVKCFFCDLGLRDWNPGDIPAAEHAKFSPLCFFLKASRGLDWLKQQSSRPPNYPTSYLRQDHNELMKLIKLELQAPYAKAVCGCGFNDTRVLLCIARKFIRQRAKFALADLVRELQAELDREILDNENATLFPGQFNLAGVLRAFKV